MRVVIISSRLHLLSNKTASCSFLIFWFWSFFCDTRLASGSDLNSSFRKATGNYVRAIRKVNRRAGFADRTTDTLKKDRAGTSGRWYLARLNYKWDRRLAWIFVEYWKFYTVNNPTRTYHNALITNNLPYVCVARQASLPFSRAGGGWCTLPPTDVFF